MTGYKPIHRGISLTIHYSIQTITLWDVPCEEKIGTKSERVRVFSVLAVTTVLVVISAILSMDSAVTMIPIKGRKKRRGTSTCITRILRKSLALLILLVAVSSAALTEETGDKSHKQV